MGKMALTAKTDRTEPSALLGLRVKQEVKEPKVKLVNLVRPGKTAQ